MDRHFTFNISFIMYKESSWGGRKLGKGRIALDFWKFSIHFEKLNY